MVFNYDVREVDASLGIQKSKQTQGLFDNSETRVSNSLDRVGSLRHEFVDVSHVNQLADAALELWGFYNGWNGNSYTARYLAGEILGVNQEVLNLQTRSWIKELRQKGTPASRVDLDFMRNHHPCRVTRIAATNALLISNLWSVFS